MKTLLLTKIKNDNKWLDEWIMHHIYIGFSKIIIYDTNSSFEDYPMSDYVISMCASGKVKIKNFRNKTVDLQIESFSNEYANYDFIICLDIDEFMSSKDYDKLVDALYGEKTSLSLRTYPFDISDTKRLMLNKYFYYQNKIFINTKNKDLSNTTKIYVEKFPNRDINEWKKHVQIQNEKS